MCGIIGFYTNKVKKEHIDILLELIFQSKIRGLHSFGLSYYKDGKITTERYFGLAENILDGFKSSGSNMLIYHNRYSTSGDWEDMNNNQPITIGNVSVAVNGVLSMKPKEEYEQEFNVKCNTENDSEVFAQKIVNNENIPQFIKDYPENTTAMVVLKDGSVYALRNNSRPLHWFKLHDAVFVVSTVDIVRRALGSEIEIFDIPKFEWVDLHEKL